jgi:hypothetical protein
VTPVSRQRRVVSWLSQPELDTLRSMPRLLAVGLCCAGMLYASLTLRRSVRVVGGVPYQNSGSRYERNAATVLDSAQRQFNRLGRATSATARRAWGRVRDVRAGHPGRGSQTRLKKSPAVHIPTRADTSPDASPTTFPRR